MKVAVLGYGFLGRWHCEKANTLLNENFYALVEKFPEAQKTAREKFPHLKIVSDLKEIIDQIDAAIVVTPTSTHFEIVSELLKKKKHVFCEKPLGISKDEIKQIKKLADPQLVLQVGHIERFQHVWQEWKKYFEHKSPFTMRFKRTGVFKGRATDVPVTTDLLIHDLDLLFWLKKERPIQVQASGHILRSTFVDEVECQFTYQDGSIASFLVSRNSIKETREIEITDNRGTLNIDFLTQTIQEASKDFPHGAFVKTHQFIKVDQLLEEQKHFYDCIADHKKPLVGLEAAMEAQVYIDKVHEALSSGKILKL